MTEPWDGDIVSPDRIPVDIKDEIDEIFPQSEGRRKIAYALMFWDRKPNSKEKEELAQWAGFKAASTTHTILNKLKENGLFTDTVGSIPLSRSLLDIAVEKQQQQIKSLTPLSPLSHSEETARETPEPLAETLDKTTDSLAETHESLVKSPPLSSQIDTKTRLDAAEKQIKLLERTTAAGFEDVKKLMGDMVNPLEAAPRANPLTVDPPEPEAEEVEVELVNPGPDEVGPFAGMSKDDIIDIAMNDPEKIYAMRTGYMRGDKTIMAMPETMRWMGVMLTTYTQNAFERSIWDGYEGSLSDFLNDCVFQYFADRGKALQWVDLPPMNKARSGVNRWPYPERRPMGDD